MNTRIGFIIAIVATAIIAGCSHSGSRASTRDIWTLHEPNTELYQPCFSSTGEEIAIVRKRHIPDGHEAEMISEREIDELWRRVEKDERYADPQVVVVNLGSKKVAPVGWGWAPSFSPDDQRIAYSHQLRPASRLRILASTLSGNEIRIFERSTSVTTTVVKPKTGFLTGPIFSGNGESMVYSVGDAVNGAWPGNVGIGKLELRSGESEILYPPTKEYGFYHLIDDLRFVSGRMLALRATPDSPGGSYLADAYVYDLIDVGPPASAVYSWGRGDRYGRDARAFGSSQKGGVLVFDEVWRETSVEGADSTGADVSRNEDPGTVSPDGTRIAIHRESTIAVVQTSDGAEVWSHPIDGEPHAIAWSLDSTQLALILTRYRGQAGELFSHDELLVATP